eukprot:1717016-Prymnesium_polylepis.3
MSARAQGSASSSSPPPLFFLAHGAPFPSHLRARGVYITSENNDDSGTRWTRSEATGWGVQLDANICLRVGLSTHFILWCVPEPVVGDIGR